MLVFQNAPMVLMEIVVFAKIATKLALYAKDKLLINALNALLDSH